MTLWLVIAAVFVLVLALVFAILGGDDLSRLSGKRFSGRARGTVDGMVRHRFLQRYEKTGRVPDDAYHYWGYSTAHGVQFALLSALGRKNWYPCVQFSAGGRTVSSISPNGFGRDVWNIGQEVEVKYDPSNPAECLIVNQTALRRMAALHFGAALLCAVLAVALLVAAF